MIIIAAVATTSAATLGVGNKGRRNLRSVRGCTSDRARAGDGLRLRTAGKQPDYWGAA